MAQRKRYKARPERILKVGERTVTDDPRGVPLRDTPSVREHVRLGRLIEVQPAAPARPDKKEIH